MVGIVIATHGQLAAGLLDAAQLIMGEQAQVATLGLHHGDDVTAFGQDLVRAAKSVSTGDGVLVLTDLFGASPNNQAATARTALTSIPYALLTGVNLPMLLTAFNERLLGSDLITMKQAVLTAGQTGIKDFFVELAKQ